VHYAALAGLIRVGVSEAHRGVRRLELAGLVMPGERRVDRQALVEFLVHGVRYVFAPVLGAEASGVATAAAAPGLVGKFPGGAALVWPFPGGKSRGRSLLPLYRGAPAAALEDPWLYRALALVDVLRIGQLQERRQARALLDDDLAAPPA
jgi:hypothetical protein